MWGEVEEMKRRKWTLQQRRRTRERGRRNDKDEREIHCRMSLDICLTDLNCIWVARIISVGEWGCEL